MTRHPLDDTFRRGRRRTHRGCDLGTAIGGLPLRPAGPLFTAPDELRSALGRVVEDVGSERLDVAASLLLEAYAWQVLLPVAGAVVAEARAPLPRLDDVWLPSGEARPGSSVLRPGRFGVLRDDPDLAHPDAVPVADERALTQLLRAGLEQHFTPVVAALNSASARPRGALWRTVADRCATAFLYAGAACELPERGERLGGAVLDGGPPLCAQARYVTRADRGGRLERVHERRGCCLWWRTRAATTCSTCPLGDVMQVGD